MRLKGMLFLTYLLNVIFIGFVFGIFGVFVAIAISLAAYALLHSKDALKGWSVKIMLYVPHVIGIIAVHAQFQNSFFTLLAGVGEVAVMMIFSSV